MENIQMSWLCEVCNKTYVDESPDSFFNNSRIVKIDIPQSGEKMKYGDVDSFEFKNVCLACRIKLSNAIYNAIEEINPEIHYRD